ncbi:MAG: hypothetical protein PHT88_01045 [Candidatus Moranbacteria bacterium]|nr:hypothetical protein [Candidatus Moranbacteria bacterium]
MFAGLVIFTLLLCWFTLRQYKQLREIKRYMGEVRNTVPLHRKINFFRNFGLLTLADAKNQKGKIQFNFSHLASLDDVWCMKVHIFNEQRDISLKEAVDNEYITMDRVEEVFNRAIDYYLKHGTWKFEVF